ncbi:hypothetical protein BGZ65_004631, partial [Modicella reniformis]
DEELLRLQRKDLELDLTADGGIQHDDYPNLRKTIQADPTKDSSNGYLIQMSPMPVVKLSFKHGSNG